MPTSLEIDKYNLDEELIRQPQLFQDVGEELVQAVSLRDEASERLKVVDAELDREIREQMIADGEKLTEGRVSSRVSTHPLHAEAQGGLHELKEQAEILRVRKEAWSQRAYALRDLVQLYVAGYFSITSVKVAGHENAKQEHEDLRKKAGNTSARRSIAEAMARRKRGKEAT